MIIDPSIFTRSKRKL